MWDRLSTILTVIKKGTMVIKKNPKERCNSVRIQRRECRNR
ncbi:hypothetical protein HanXRQr2_Chr15g0684511 [Helianthus annuus]|uniref:Uncharacterized protein n=1 Tax=Helianthus annuus TaxID=4232 RepID=A0A9K3DZ30_HELAN|nr:hypothetical protein HanXRQr2_Chr15g0684511 [Helianthus annuus]KAJ0830515.1 hypothetical protein HanPSC8_Chr15g0656331 [Helianthus annuus]